MFIAFEENGVSKQREATAEEIAYIQSAQQEAQAVDEMLQDEAATKLAAKTALFAKLKITAEEAAFLS